MKKNKDTCLVKTDEFQLDKIIDILKRADDDGTFLTSIYDLYVIIGITKGMNDAMNGRGMTLNESKERILNKYANYSRRFSS